MRTNFILYFGFIYKEKIYKEIWGMAIDFLNKIEKPLFSNINFPKNGQITCPFLGNALKSNFDHVV